MFLIAAVSMSAIMNMMLNIIFDTARKRSRMSNSKFWFLLLLNKHNLLSAKPPNCSCITTVERSTTYILVLQTGNTNCVSTGCLDTARPDSFLGKSHGLWASPVNKTSPLLLPAVSRQLSSSATSTALRSPTNNNNHISEVRLFN